MSSDLPFNSKAVMFDPIVIGLVYDRSRPNDGEVFSEYQEQYDVLDALMKKAINVAVNFYDPELHGPQIQDKMNKMFKGVGGFDRAVDQFIGIIASEGVHSKERQSNTLFLLAENHIPPQPFTPDKL